MSLQITTVKGRRYKRSNMQQHNRTPLRESLTRFEKKRCFTVSTSITQVDTKQVEHDDDDKNVDKYFTSFFVKLTFATTICAIRDKLSSSPRSSPRPPPALPLPNSDRICEELQCNPAQTIESVLFPNWNISDTR
jgi:hypothetical protein